ncbi:hypothetical protein [Demequina sp. NBRC 110051]|uniref:hypothetical protein n=1 Tax=Demequina sp. NBRC 110051 TaxID=1570340 RepID=UPI0009FBF42D|nr:hypothetical protein [Demequina sp. NBRC 110051]
MSVLLPARTTVRSLAPNDTHRIAWRLPRAPRVVPVPPTPRDASPSAQDIRFAQLLARHLQDTLAGLLTVLRNGRIHTEVRALAQRLGLALAAYSAPLVDRLHELHADHREPLAVLPWTQRGCLRIGAPCPGRTGRCGPTALEYWDTHLRDALALCIEHVRTRPMGEAGVFARGLSRELAIQIDAVRTLRDTF